jgi:hypothetical protein
MQVSVIIVFCPIADVLVLQNEVSKTIGRGGALMFCEHSSLRDMHWTHKSLLVYWFAIGLLWVKTIISSVCFYWEIHMMLLVYFCKQ